MGACDCITDLDGNLTQEQVQKEFDRLVADDQYENGHDGYTGGFSSFCGPVDFQFADKMFQKTAEARDFIMDNHEKWSGPLAVKARTKNGSVLWFLGGWAAE